MRSLGSISQDLCDLQRLHTYNIELGAKDLEWQRQIIGTAAVATASTSVAPDQLPPRPPTHPTLSFPISLSNVKSVELPNAGTTDTSTFKSSTLPPPTQKSSTVTKSNAGMNVDDNNRTKFLKQSASPVPLSPQPQPQNHFSNNNFTHPNSTSLQSNSNHFIDLSNANTLVNNPDDVDHFSPLSSESSEPSTTTTTNTPKNPTALNTTTSASTSNIIVDEQPTMTTEQILKNSTNVMTDYPINVNDGDLKANSDSNVRGSSSTKTVTTVARKTDIKSKKKSRLAVNENICRRNERIIGKIRRHRMTKEEEARFDPADLVDLTGSTAAKSRKMTNEERDIMLHKRRLRNRASAARSRDKQRKTINELSDEMDTLLSQSEQLARRCALAEQRMSQLQSANHMLVKENTYLKQNSLFLLSSSPPTTTAAQLVLSPPQIPSADSQQLPHQTPQMHIQIQGQTGPEPALFQPTQTLSQESIHQQQQLHVNNDSQSVPALNPQLQAKPQSQTQSVLGQPQISHMELHGPPSTPVVRSQVEGSSGVTSAVAQGFRRTGSLLRVSMSSDMLDKIMGMGNGGVVEGSKGPTSSTAATNIMPRSNSSILNNMNSSSNSNVNHCNSSLVRIPSKLHVSLSTEKLQDASFAISGSSLPLARNFSVMERLLDLANVNSSFDINCDVHVRE